MSLSDADIERLAEILDQHRSKERIAGRPAPTRDNEAVCPECDARITQTSTLGEVGHQADCARRERTYKGQRGRRKKNGDYQGTLKA